MTLTPKPSRGKKVVTKDETDDTVQPGHVEIPTKIHTVTREEQQKVAEELERQGRLRIYRPEP